MQCLSGFELYSRWVPLKGGTKKRSIHIHKKYSLERWNKSKINGILPLDQTSHQEPRKLREKQEKKQIKYMYTR